LLYTTLFRSYVALPFRADCLRERVRKLALALPEAEERDSHGSPGWRTGAKSGKFFAYFNDQHHGSENIALIVKASSQDELLALCEQAPDTYFKPAYYGASGWIGVILNRPDVDWKHVSAWLERSWRSVAPKRLTGLMDAADAF
jgi:phosphoribosylglycinamide formyltransferase-1